MDIKKTNALFADGTFYELYKAGFLSNKIFVWREIYIWAIQQPGHADPAKRSQIISDAAIKFKTSERTVRRAMSSFSCIDNILSQES
jgi:hypothetical protein